MFSHSNSAELSVLKLINEGEGRALKGLPYQPPTESKGGLYVVFSDVRGSTAALEAGGKLTANLGMDLAMVVIQTVPFMLPLSDPPVSLAFRTRQIHDLISSTGLKVHARIYLCRDEAEALLRILPPGSLVLFGLKKSRLPSRARHLARLLEKRGHHVLRVTYP
jgi:hypothetical protein